MLGKLFIVATPIGNLSDISPRAIETLKNVDYIFAEDTRVSGKLLKYFDIDTPILSYHQHSDERKKLEILGFLIHGKDIALISDAGTPGISDPGNELIDYLLEKEPQIQMIPIPGPSAVIAALSVCGFRADKFVFIGFLPKKKRKKLFEWLKNGKITFCFYESPNRLIKTLEVLKENFGSDKRVFIARELTKLHETLYRGEIEQILAEMGEVKVKGEVVVIVEG